MHINKISLKSLVTPSIACYGHLRTTRRACLVLSILYVAFGYATSSEIKVEFHASESGLGLGWNSKMALN